MPESTENGPNIQKCLHYLSL